MTLAEKEERYRLIVERAHVELAEAIKRYSVEELLWDYGCNVGEGTRKIIESEVMARGISLDKFKIMGRGKRRV